MTAETIEAKPKAHRKAYWRSRSDLLYYRYVDYMIRVLAKDAGSIIDIGSGGCPYLEWWDWIPERVSFDLERPYRSDTVRGIAGDVHEHRFETRFDVCTCLQVLEHVPDAARFARRLLELAPLVIVSVPYRWPAGATSTHVHDPVTAWKLRRWMGRRPNHSMVVEEPFRRRGWRPNKGRRLIAIYHEDPNLEVDMDMVHARRPQGLI